MELVGWIARAALAVAFAVAAGTKVSDPAGTAAAVAAFGVPRRLVRATAVALPAAEVVTAVLLVVPTTAAAGAALACALLVVFSAGVLRLLARHEHPPCRCFGQASAAPVGPRTLVRNGVLLALAGVGLAQALVGPALTPAAAVHRLGSVGVVAVVGAVVALALAAFCRELLAQNGRILRRLDELEGRLAAGPGAPAPARPSRLGRAAPEFTLRRFDGGPAALADLVDARPLVLVFLAARCGPCEALLPDLRRWVVERSDRLHFVVVVSGDPVLAREKLGPDLAAVALVDEDDDVSPRYGAPGTPSAVVLDADRRFASEVTPGAPAIVSLVTALADAPPPPPAVGAPAPDFELVDLDGERWSPGRLAGLGGGVLLFWDPACGYCRALAPQLHRGGADHPIGRYVLVSAGPPTGPDDGGVGAPVLVDRERAVSRRYGITGTPIAVAIDDRGRVASAPAPGGPAVLSLLESAAGAATPSAPGPPVAAGG